MRFTSCILILCTVLFGCSDTNGAASIDASNFTLGNTGGAYADTGSTATSTDATIGIDGANITQDRGGNGAGSGPVAGTGGVLLDSSAAGGSVVDTSVTILVDARIDGSSIDQRADSGDAQTQAADGNAGDSGQDSAITDDRCNVAVYDPQNPPQSLSLSGNLITHDPTIIEQNGMYYLYQTGPRIPGKTSTNLLNWVGTPSALGFANPAWIADRVPGASDLWAPDLSRFGDQYHLYYSASTFGSNHSCIGHATRASLESGAWVDQGPVICSVNTDNWNAIDPNVIVDEQGTPWLSFGSWWSGIKVVQLDRNGARADNDLHAIASRGGGAIEAPVIVRRCGFYYLFVSFDNCCKGADSTYNVRVGRASEVLGPYVDRNGTPMMNGGGTLLVQGDNTWRGPGHNAVLFTGDRAYNIYHSYTATDGTPTLRVSELVWDNEGWPISGGP